MISVRPKSFGVKTAATPSSISRARRRGDDPADDHGHVVEAVRPHPVEHLGHQLHVRAGQDRQPDAVHVLGHRGGDDLLGRQPDALVDHLEARVAGPHGHLLGTVGVPVQARLADQQPQPAAPSSSPVAAHLLADRGELGPGLGDARRHRRRRWGRGTRRTPRAACRPTRRWSPRPGRRRGWRSSGSRRSWRPRRARASASATSASSRSALHASSEASAWRSASGSAVWMAASRSAVSGEGSVVSN